MANLEELFGPAWPLAFFEWLGEEQAKKKDLRLLEGGWKPEGFVAKVLIDMRETCFFWRPTEQQQEARERELSPANSQE